MTSSALLFVASFFNSLYNFGILCVESSFSFLSHGTETSRTVCSYPVPGTYTEQQFLVLPP